ncbi:hypothetical protein L6164_028300 [Bauhinia variegata]|uniref:Uncharacterized protein n=1 Tax=Bauhinia variegata TaxID=167791 RepID=A0ACB9LX63_BAUVA|nr:hypothetical protein L6164_028300 [Bauhinia variegata]
MSEANPATSPILLNLTFFSNKAVFRSIRRRYSPGHSGFPAFNYNDSRNRAVVDSQNFLVRLQWQPQTFDLHRMLLLSSAISSEES